MQNLFSSSRRDGWMDGWKMIKMQSSLVFVFSFCVRVSIVCFSVVHDSVFVSVLLRLFCFCHCFLLHLHLLLVLCICFVENKFLHIVLHAVFVAVLQSWVCVQRRETSCLPFLYCVPASSVLLFPFYSSSLVVGLFLFLGGVSVSVRSWVLGFMVWVPVQQQFSILFHHLGFCFLLFLSAFGFCFWAFVFGIVRVVCVLMLLLSWGGWLQWRCERDQGRDRLPSDTSSPLHDSPSRLLSFPDRSLQPPASWLRSPGQIWPNRYGSTCGISILGSCTHWSSVFFFQSCTRNPTTGLLLPLPPLPLSSLSLSTLLLCTLPTVGISFIHHSSFMKNPTSFPSISRCCCCHRSSIFHRRLLLHHVIMQPVPLLLAPPPCCCLLNPT